MASHSISNIREAACSDNKEVNNNNNNRCNRTRSPLILRPTFTYRVQLVYGQQKGDLSWLKGLPRLDYMETP